MHRLFGLFLCGTMAVACASTDSSGEAAAIRAADERVRGCFTLIESVTPYTTTASDGIGLEVGLEELDGMRAHAPQRPIESWSAARFRSYLAEEVRRGGASETAIAYESFGSEAYAVTVGTLPSGRRYAQVSRNGIPCGIVPVNRRQ